MGTSPEDAEDSWTSIRNAILTAARDVLSAVQRARRPWLTAETLGLLDKKRDAGLRGHANLCPKYKDVFKARSKEDLDNYYIRLAGEAEVGVKSRNLRSAYRKRSNVITPAIMASFQSCETTAKFVMRLRRL